MMDEIQAEMPKYQCHKTVHALKISRIETTDDSPTALLYFEDHSFAPKTVDESFVRRHKPEVGGYYVVYDDGYASWSPAKAFEDGYSRI